MRVSLFSDTPIANFDEDGEDTNLGRMRSDEKGEFTYYSEFELIDLETLETKEQVKTFSMFTKENLLREIKLFFVEAGELVQ